MKYIEGMKKSNEEMSINIDDETYCTPILPAQASYSIQLRKGSNTWSTMKHTNTNETIIVIKNG